MKLVGKNITIFGGTGFIGRYIVKEAAKTGARIYILSRDPEAALFLKTAGSVGQISFIYGNVFDQKKIEDLVSKSDIIINAVGILSEQKKKDFINYHIKFPTYLGEIATKFKVKKLIHISALGIDHNPYSQYAKTKLEGEKALKANFKEVIILRPSVVFGEEDKFFNKFAKLIQYSPIIPLIKKGEIKFQPIYVNDVAKSVHKILISEEKYNGNIYELGGAEIISLKEILMFIEKHLNKKRIHFNMPLYMAKTAAYILDYFLSPIFTYDQLLLLKTDNITQNEALTLFDLQIQPQTIEEIVPEYLKLYISKNYHISSES